MFKRQPRSPASSVAALEDSTLAHFSDAILPEMSPYLTAKVPPKPQQISASRISVRVKPLTLASNLRGCALTPSSRRPEQEL